MKHINKNNLAKNTHQENHKLYLSQDISKAIYMEQYYNTQSGLISKFTTMFSTILKRPKRQGLLSIISFLIFSLSSSRFQAATAYLGGG